MNDFNRAAPGYLATHVKSIGRWRLKEESTGVCVLFDPHTIGNKSPRQRAIELSYELKREGRRLADLTDAELEGVW